MVSAHKALMRIAKFLALEPLANHLLRLSINKKTAEIT